MSMLLAVTGNDISKKAAIIFTVLQRRFTKLIDGTKGLSYEQHLSELNLHTLAFRSKREQLIQVFKL